MITVLKLYKLIFFVTERLLKILLKQLYKKQKLLPSPGVKRSTIHFSQRVVARMATEGISTFGVASVDCCSAPKPVAAKKHAEKKTPAAIDAK